MPFCPTGIGFFRNVDWMLVRLVAGVPRRSYRFPMIERKHQQRRQIKRRTSWTKRCCSTFSRGWCPRFYWSCHRLSCWTSRTRTCVREILCVFLSSEKAVVLLYLHIFYRQRFTHLNLYIIPSEYYLRYDIAFHHLSCLLTEFIFFFPRPTR